MLIIKIININYKVQNTIIHLISRLVQKIFVTNFNIVYFITTFCNIIKSLNYSKYFYINRPFPITIPSLSDCYDHPFNFQNEFAQYFYLHYHFPTVLITAFMIIGFGTPYFVSVFEASFGVFQSVQDQSQIVNHIFEEIEKPTIPTLDLISIEEKLKRLDGSFYEEKDCFTISTQELLQLYKNEKIN